MRLFRCIFCNGEIEFLNLIEHIVNRKIKCKRCGFTNCTDLKKEPEIIVIRKKN